MLNCPNVRCQAVNPLDDKFCQVCGTPLGRRYLWILGATMTAQRIGETIADRYLVVQPRLLLDTQPATPPETPEDFPPEIALYLRLFNQRLHIPQVYGRVLDATPLWLLEGIPMIGDALQDGKADRLAPELTTVWSEAPPLRQLSWLKQIAALWDPLHQQGVSASLLNPELVRVNGSLVKLLELRSNDGNDVGLPDLGQQWLTLVQPQSLIARFLEEIGIQLITGAIADTSSLLATLDGGIQQCRDSVSHQYQILTATDQGPTREGNEDACYPAPGVVTSLQEGLLAIVCDGIGGHEGGEVASGLAIATVQTQVEQIQPKASYTAQEIEHKLEAAVRRANDVISDRNDREQRQSRQRMGTTIVMAWSRDYELYLSHVGDSRAYWITATGCYQITLDDDIASREVSLGYALYREALKYPSSGSLVQALGMTSSTNLYPTVQRFIPDESGIFLLCSDGLSDYDRVEQNWENLILPVLRGETNLPNAMANLLNLANTQNGHDNVTIALIHCQVTLTTLPAPLVFHKILAPVTNPVASPAALPPLKVQKTVELPQRQKTPYVLGLVTIILAGGLGVWAAIQLGLISPLFPSTNSPTISSTGMPDPQLSPKPATTTTPSATIPKSPNSPAVVSSQLVLQPGDRLKLTSPILLPLTKNPNQRVELPINTVLQVVKQTAAPNQEKLVELTVCLVPNPSSNLNPSSNPNPNNSPLGNVTIPSQSLSSVVDRTYPKSSSIAIGSCGVRSNPIIRSPSPLG